MFWTDLAAYHTRSHARRPGDTNLHGDLRAAQRRVPRTVRRRVDRRAAVHLLDGPAMDARASTTSSRASAGTAPKDFRAGLPRGGGVPSTHPSDVDGAGS